MERRVKVWCGGRLRTEVVRFQIAGNKRDGNRFVYTGFGCVHTKSGAATRPCRPVCSRESLAYRIELDPLCHNLLCGFLPSCVQGL